MGEVPILSGPVPGSPAEVKWSRMVLQMEAPAPGLKGGFRSRGVSRAVMCFRGSVISSSSKLMKEKAKLKERLKEAEAAKKTKADKQDEEKPAAPKKMPIKMPRSCGGCLQ